MNPLRALRHLLPLLLLLPLALLLPILAGCHSSSGAEAPIGCGPDPTVPVAVPSPAERDLVLELAVANSDAVLRGEPVELRWTVRNASAMLPHRIVQGGDGSECGWREPQLELAAESLGPDGAWQPIPRLGYGRCGVYDPQWRDDVVSIAPGGSVELQWAPWTQAFYDLSKHDRVRLRATYRFTRGAAGKGIIDERMRGAGDSNDPGIEAFTLHSVPLEIQIR